MKTAIPAIGLVLGLTLGISAFAQNAAPKLAIMNIQAAIAQSTEGQSAAKELQNKFAPKRAELEKQQKEIIDLQNQLRTQDNMLSEDAKTRLLRSIDDKTKAFNRTNEDATSEFQQAEQDAVNEIGRKMMGVVTDYAKKNSYQLVLDVSQSPILYADAAIDITEKIMELYDQTSAQIGAAPAATAPSGATTATTPAPQPAPAATTPATTP
ncbi:MAG: hypothetical protein A3F68_09045 [Acidobacteria bacterium RIFCSPLOWO2_12_FULL_54_10]|nr:MAG: hypothetical protein A3F68_09045 [Acidobacteria bacterium RIFCSPLOWO2_12_FULL_54_10]